jgi:hypothetical protein
MSNRWLQLVKQPLLLVEVVVAAAKLKVTMDRN